jgi:outer membrane protein TolC
MSSRRLHRVGMAGALLVGLACAFACPLTASEYLQPEWQVGQEQVSPQDLAVIVPPAAPAELTIEDAVSLALRHNLGFRRTTQRLLNARSEWRVAQQRWDLELYGSIQRSGNGETVEDRQAGAALYYSAVTGADFSVVAELDRLADEESEETVTATLRQPLLAGRGPASSAYEQLRRARNTYRAALMSFYVERQSLIERVISSYFNGVQQQQLVSIRQFSVTMAEEEVRAAGLRLEEQVAVGLDLMRAQLRLATEQRAEVLARQSLADTMDGLVELLGLEIGGMPTLVTQVAYEPSEIDLDASVGRALDLRPEVRLMALDIEDAEAVLRIARSQRMPSLDLFGAWRRTTNGFDDRSWDVGLELSVPIASRSLDEGAQQARWALLIAQQEREALIQQITAEVRSQVRAAEAARQNVTIATKSVEVAKDSLTAARRFVEEGLRTNLYVLDSMDALTRDETSLVTSKINYYLAVVRLRRAMGLDISQDLPTERAQAPLGAAEQPADAAEATDVSGVSSTSEGTDASDVTDAAEGTEVPDETPASDAPDETGAPEVSTE